MRDNGSGPECKGYLDAAAALHYIGPTMGTKGDKPGADREDEARDEKARRLTEALRQNLRRRKVQARARAGAQRGDAPGKDTDKDNG